MPAVTNKTAKRSVQTIVERLGADGARPAVDREKATISNVKVLGLESVNGPRYHKAYKSAAKLYEGAFVSLNHPADGAIPSVESRIGSLSGISATEDGLRAGTLRLNPEHPATRQILWFAENEPGAIALSHRVEASARRSKDGAIEVESIDRVLGVELVSDGGTTRSLFESADSSAPAATSAELEEPAAVEACVAAMVAKGHDKDKAYAVCSAQHAKMESAAVPISEAEVGDKVLCSGYGSERMIGEVVKKATALLVRVGDSLRTMFEDEAEVVTTEPAAASEDATMKTLATLTHDELRAARPDFVDAVLKESKDGDKVATELKALRDERDALKLKVDAAEVAAKLEAKKAARLAMCEAASLPADSLTDTFKAALLRAETDDEAKALIEDRAKLLGTARSPTSRTSSHEKQSGKGEKLTDERLLESVFA